MEQECGVGKIQTLEEALPAVKYRGSNLEYVPKSLKTKEVCWEAVRCDPYALKWVPFAMWLDPDFCLEAIEQQPESVHSVPGKVWQDKEFCRKAVKLTDKAAAYIPELSGNRAEFFTPH